MLVPYPEDGREATDHRRPSILQNPLQYLMVLDKRHFSGNAKNPDFIVNFPHLKYKELAFCSRLQQMENVREHSAKHCVDFQEDSLEIK